MNSIIVVLYWWLMYIGWWVTLAAIESRNGNRLYYECIRLPTPWCQVLMTVVIAKHFSPRAIWQWALMRGAAEGKKLELSVAWLYPEQQKKGEKVLTWPCSLLTVQSPISSVWKINLQLFVIFYRLQDPSRATPGSTQCCACIIYFIFSTL